MSEKMRSVIGLAILMSIVLVCLSVTNGNAEDQKASVEGGDPESVSQLVERGDAVMQKAVSGFEPENVRNFARAAEIYELAVEQQPDNYEANWKCARACRFYGEESRKLNVSDWKEICAEYGEKGMHYALRATEIDPERVEGYYYYGLCSGTYSDGVGIVTALRKGLKNKVKNNLKAAYEIDRTFEFGGPIVALGRFWQVVPWPYKDEEKAMEYFLEFSETEFFNDSHSVQCRIFLAEIIMDKRGEESKAEARRLLESVSGLTEDPYWISTAQSMMKEL